MKFYSAKDLIYPPIGPDHTAYGEPASIAFTFGMELFVLAHECAHVLVRRSSSNLSRSEVWKQELDADWLGYRILQDVMVKMNRQESFIQMAQVAPIFGLGVISVLERETYF